MKPIKGVHTALTVSGVAIVAAAASPAMAQSRSFNVPAQAALTAIPELARQADVQILVGGDTIRGKRTATVRGVMTIEDALRRLLKGTGLGVMASDGRTFTLAARAPAANAPAIVKDPPAPDIVVTGTRISRPQRTSAAPVTTVASREIEEQGAVTIEEVLNHLPQIDPDSQQTYQDSDGRQRVRLRNLGFERTLVLVDGKRLGTQNGEDVGIIPASMVDRIDVLSGGASSVYGSDAIAGVVNFILRKDISGVRIDVGDNFYDHDNRANLVTPIARAAGFATPLGQANDGRRIDVTVSAGKHVFGDALKLSGFVNYRRADPIPYGARSTSACQLNELVKDGVLTCQVSTYSTSGFITPLSGPNARSPFVNDPSGGRAFVPYGVGPGLAANPYDGSDYQRHLERWNAGGFGTLRLADAAELYATAIWFHDRSENPGPARVLSYTVYGNTPYRVNCDNPFLSPSQAKTICGGLAGSSATVPLDIRYRFADLPPVPDIYINQGLRATGGIRGAIGGAWRYDLGGVYARNRQDETDGAYPVFDRVNRSLDVVTVNGVPTCASKVSGLDPACVPFDAFGANANGRPLANYLFARQDGTVSGVSTLYDGLLTVTGDLSDYGFASPLAGHGVAIALGIEYRADRFGSHADAAYRALIGGTDIDLGQHVWEGNVELQAPIVEKRAWAEQLQFNGGYRLSRYDTNPRHFGTWKVEALYAPIPDITFRGSINRVQRAPTVIEIFQAKTISFAVQGGSENDFCAGTVTQELDPSDPSGTRRIPVYHPPIASREVCAATGLTGPFASLYGSTTLSCPNSQCTVRSGGLTVDPETAFTKTFGVVLKPKFLPDLTITVDRYLIDLRHAINFNYYTYYYNGCLQSGLPYFCSNFVRDPTTGILYNAPKSNPDSGFIRQGTTNYYKETSHGWDVQARYLLKTERAGSIEWLFNGSLSTFGGGQDSPILPSYNCAAGYYGAGCRAIPQWTHGWRTTYTTPDGAVGVSLNWRYVGPLTDTTNSGLFGFTAADARKTFYHIPPYHYFDLSLTFAVGQRFGLRFAANNLFDKDPPILPNSYAISLTRGNTIPARYDPLGRNIAIGTTMRF